MYLANSRSLVASFKAPPVAAAASTACDVRTYSGGCAVARQRITCSNCGSEWQVPQLFSIYEQQAVESRPCTRCGANTLKVHDPAGFSARQRSPRSRVVRFLREKR